MSRTDMYDEALNRAQNESEIYHRAVARLNERQSVRTILILAVTWSLGSVIFLENYRYYPIAIALLLIGLIAVEWLRRRNQILIIDKTYAHVETMAKLAAINTAAEKAPTPGPVKFIVE